ncbi:hypothetical protein GCM10009616_35840 [Microlunatus lacustris]
MPRTKDQILRDLDPNRPETIQTLIDFHRQSLGGFVMEDDKDKGDDPDKGADKDKGGGGKDDPDDGKDDEKGLGEAGKKAIKSERDARKALEKELSDFKVAQADQAKKLAEALGIETKDAKSSDDVLDTLKAEVDELRLERLVDKVARDSKVTDEDDIALIRAAGSEDAMRKLAGRLAPKGDARADKAGAGQQRRFPRPDPSQGQGGAETGRPTSIKQVQAERAAARAAKKS